MPILRGRWQRREVRPAKPSLQSVAQGTAVEMRPPRSDVAERPRINNVRSKLAGLIGVLHTQRVERYQDDPELERYAKRC